METITVLFTIEDAAVEPAEIRIRKIKMDKHTSSYRLRLPEVDVNVTIAE